MSKLEANIPIDHSEKTIDSSDTVEIEQDLSERWSRISEVYYSDDWYFENPENNTIVLNIQYPKRLIEYQSEQLTQALDTKHDSKEPEGGVDLKPILNDVTLVTKIAEDYNIEIGAESPVYRLFLQMSKITNNDFNHLPNMDISVLITTLERAARLLPEANEETETHNLRSKLVNLSIRVRAYLDSESSLRSDSYSYTVDEGEEEQYNNTYFDPYSYMVVEGEEEQYSNTYKVYEGENVSFTKYNIDKSVPGRAYFKSCGIFIRVEDDKPRSAKADFTPFNVQLPRVVYYRQAIAMAYRGMKNFLHAFDQHQIGTEQLKEIYGYTNPTMAKFVLRFGFKIKLDEIDKKDLDIEDDSDNITIYSREDIKSNNINLDDLTHVSVVGSIEDIRSELARFEEKGSVERIVTGKKNPTSKRDIRYIFKKLKKL